MSHIAGSALSPVIDIIPEPIARIRIASARASPTKNGILKFVEYAIMERPIARVTNGTIMELVTMFTISIAITNRNFPKGAQDSILELYASVSIWVSSDIGSLETL